MSKALRGLIVARDVDKTLLAALIKIGDTDQSASHDRALAIVAAVYVEDALQNAISTHLGPLSADKYDSLIFTDEHAPLVGLSARIRMASALGILVEPFRQDLTLIRNIRNAFAHSSSEITFSTKAVRDAVDAFITTAHLTSAELEAGTPGREGRAKFIVTVAALCSYLEKYDGRWTPSSHWRKALGPALLHKLLQLRRQARKNRSGKKPTPSRRPRSSQA